MVLTRTAELPHSSSGDTVSPSREQSVSSTELPVAWTMVYEEVNETFSALRVDPSRTRPWARPTPFTSHHPMTTVEFLMRTPKRAFFSTWMPYSQAMQSTSVMPPRAFSKEELTMLTVEPEIETPRSFVEETSRGPTVSKATSTRSTSVSFAVNTDPAAFHFTCSKTRREPAAARKELPGASSTLLSDISSTPPSTRRSTSPIRLEP